MCLLSLSVQPFETLWMVACQSPLSTGFSRQEHRGGLPFLPPADLPNPGIELVSPMSPVLQVDSLPAQPSGKPLRDWCPTLSHLDPWTSVKGISDGQFPCLTEAKVNCPCRKSRPELQITFINFHLRSF